MFTPDFASLRKKGDPLRDAIMVVRLRGHPSAEPHELRYYVWAAFRLAQRADL